MILTDLYEDFILFGVEFFPWEGDPQGFIKAGMVYYTGNLRSVVNLYDSRSSFVGKYHIPHNLVKTRLPGKGKVCTLRKLQIEND